jgi:hypothetical protein
MGQKKGFRSMPIISISMLVTIALPAIWFSPVVESSNQTQLGTSPAISMNVARVNGRDYVNNTIWNFLAAESQARGQSAQYKLDSGFINWYVSNVNALPGNSRNLTQQNISSLFQSFLSSGENSYKLAQNAVNNESLMYSPVVITINASNDPWVWETYTPIHIDILGWVSMWEEKFASFMEFKTLTNAQNFKNALAQELTWTGVVDDLFAGLVFLTTAGAVGAVSVTLGSIICLLSGVYNDLLPAASLVSLNNNINTAFGAQEDESGIFKIAYELDYYPDTLSSAYSVYAPIPSGGSINFLSGINSLELLGSGPMDSYIGAFDNFENQYGLNNPIYVSAPSSWTAYFGQYGPNL